MTAAARWRSEAGHGRQVAAEVRSRLNPSLDVVGQPVMISRPVAVHC